jgi:hypothetical protein
MIINKENKFIQIEKMYFQDFNYAELPNKILKLRTRFTEIDLLDYFLSKIGFSSNLDGVIFFYPILLLEEEFILKQAPNIVTHIPYAYFPYFNKSIGKNKNLDQLYKYHIIDILTSPKNFKMAFLQEKLKIFHTNFSSDFDIEISIANLFTKLLFVKEEIPLDKCALLTYIVKHCTNNPLTSIWQSVFYNVITKHNSKKYLVNLVNLTDTTILKSINHFNSLKEANSEQSHLITLLINRFLDKYPDKVNLTNYFNLMLHSTDSFSVHNLSEFIDFLDKRNIDTHLFKKDFCHFRWNVFMKLPITSMQRFTKYGITIDDKELNEMVLSHLKTPKSNSILMMEAKGDLNSYSTGDSEEKDISREIINYLSTFLIYDANKNEESYEFLKNLMLTTKNMTLLYNLSRDITNLTKYKLLVPLILSKLINDCELKIHQEKSQNYEENREKEKIIRARSHAIKNFILHIDLSVDSFLLNRLIGLNEQEISDTCHVIISDLCIANK